MVAKISIRLFVLLLLVAIACTKENTNSTSSSLASGTTDELKLSRDNRSNDRNVVAEWILTYDWGCNGNYFSTLITINDDGTWHSNDGFDNGHWAKGAGILVLNFDGYPTIYTGNVYPNAIRGFNTTFGAGSPSDGCFSLNPATGKNFKAHHPSGEPGANGMQ
jgi:hypothetical protein